MNRIFLRPGIVIEVVLGLEDAWSGGAKIQIRHCCKRKKKLGGMGQGRGWRGRLKTEEKSEEFMREFSVKIFDETQ